MALQNIIVVAPGSDAFSIGFLNAGFANTVINRLNRINDFTVKLPPGWGSGKIVDSETNMELDLTGIKLPFTKTRLLLIANGAGALVDIPMTVITV